MEITSEIISKSSEPLRKFIEFIRNSRGDEYCAKMLVWSDMYQVGFALMRSSNPPNFLTMIWAESLSKMIHCMGIEKAHCTEIVDIVDQINKSASELMVTALADTETSH